MLEGLNNNIPNVLYKVFLKNVFPYKSFVLIFTQLYKLKSFIT